MFIETNDIKCCILNIDGFIAFDSFPNLDRSRIWSLIDDKTAIEARLLPEFQSLIDIIRPKFPFRVVSKLSSSQLETIIKRNKSSIRLREIFVPNQDDDVEKTINFHAVIKRAIDDISSPSYYSVYITAESNTILRALDLHLGTIIFRYKKESLLEEEEEYRSGPDFVIEAPEELVRIIERRFVGFIAEYKACPRTMRAKIVAERQISIQYFEVPNQDMPDNKIFVGGRYLPKDDARCQKHPLSIRIRNSKHYPDRHKLYFAEMLKSFADMVSNNSYDFITSVPTRPSEPSDRFEMFLGAIPVICPAFDRSKINVNIVKCIRDYPSQKTAGSYDDRKRNVEGAFQIIGDVRGKTIVLVDDVVTSGATLYEITKILMEAGCRKVYPAALALTTTKKATDGKTHLICENCGGHLKPRCNGADGNVFWGCENYAEGAKHTTMDFYPGLIWLNEHTEMPIIEIPRGFDIPF